MLNVYVSSIRILLLMKLLFRETWFVLLNHYCPFRNVIVSLIFKKYFISMVAMVGIVILWNGGSWLTYTSDVFTVVKMIQLVLLFLVLVFLLVHHFFSLLILSLKNTILLVLFWAVRTILIFISHFNASFHHLLLLILLRNRQRS